MKKLLIVYIHGQTEILSVLRRSSRASPGATC